MDDRVLDMILEQIKEIKEDIRETRKQVTKSAVNMEGIRTRVMIVCALGGGFVIAVAEVLANYFIGTRGQ